MDASAAMERWEPDLDAIRLDDLPESYREVAEAIGLTPALILVEERGGGKLTVPARHQPGHPLESRLGRAAWGQLCETYRGARLDVPSLGVISRPARDRAICTAYWEHRVSATDLARRFGLAERTVQLIVSARMSVGSVTGR